MQENLTPDTLIRCFQEKERYKGTTAFIVEVNKYNEAVYPCINAALAHTLLGNTPNYISKLFALRFFKEVLLTGNFTLIDLLDEEIEEHLVAVAQYNRKSRELNRGANYFIEVEKLKKDAEIQRIGSSYVLLAIEIVAVFSRWYAVDDEGKQSRFAEYAKELMKNGVTMPAVGQYNFFKKEEQEKFRKNYNKWLQWYVKNMKQQDKSQNKGKNIEKKQVEGVLPTILEENKQQGSPLEALNLKEKDLVSKIVQPDLKKEKNSQNTPIFATFRQDEKMKGDYHNLDANAVTGNCLNVNAYLQTTNMIPSTKLESNLSKTKQESEKINKQQNEQKLKGEEELRTKENIQRIKLIQELHKKLAEKDQIITKLEEQTKKHEEQIKKKDSELLTLVNQKQSLSKKMDELLSKPVQIPKENQCYNIFISPPLNLDQVIDQNDILKQTIEILQESNKKTEQLLKQQNVRLLTLLREKQLEIVKLQSQSSNIENQIIKNLIHEDSLVISDQIKINKLSALPINIKNTPIEEKRDILLKNCSVSEYLRKQQKEINENQPPKIEGRSRSLKKTQSQRKLKKVYEHQKGVSQTGADFYRSPTATPKLHKTVQNFTKSIYEGSSKIVTIYPFLEDYFPKLPDGCPKFKSHCLQLLDSSKPYFQNEFIKVALKVISLQKFIVGIQNRTNQDQKIKLVSGHYSVMIEGEKAKKIPSTTAAEFDIKAVNIDLNLRYPVVSVLVGNHGISLTNANSNDKVFHIPLPITLLNYCSFKNSRSVEISAIRAEYRKVKYMSDRFMLSSSFSSIRECFPLLTFGYEEKESVYRGVISCHLFEDALVLAQIKENNRQITLSVEFESVSKHSSDFSKVLLQVLTFLLKG